MSDSIIVSLILELEDRISEALGKTQRDVRNFTDSSKAQFDEFSNKTKSNFEELRARFDRFSEPFKNSAHKIKVYADIISAKIKETSQSADTEADAMTQSQNFVQTQFAKTAEAMISSYDTTEKAFIGEKIINFAEHTELYNKALLQVGTSAISTSNNLLTLQGAVGDLTSSFGGEMVVIAQQYADTTEMVKGAYDLEFVLTQIKTVTRATDDEMGLLKEKALELNKSTAYNAVQVGESMNSLARSGYTAAESIQVVGDVLNFAYGNTIEMSEAAGYLTSALSIFGLQKDSASRVVDVMSKGAALANTNVSELGLALTYSGKQASTMGYSIEKTTAMLDLLADNGLRGEKAGTALRAMLVSLSNPASKARDSLARLGDTSGDFDSSMQTIAKAVASTDDRIRNLGQTAILSFDVSAGAALHSFVDMAVSGLANGTGALTKYETQLANSAGFTQQSTNMLMATTKGMYAQIDSAWHGLLDSIQEPLLDTIKSAANISIIWVNSVANIIDWFKETFPGLTKLLAFLVLPIGLVTGGVKMLMAVFFVFTRLLIGQAIWGIKSYALGMINAMNATSGATVNQKLWNGSVSTGQFLLTSFNTLVRTLTIQLIAGLLPMIAVIELFNYIQSSAGLANVAFKALTITVLILTASMRGQLATGITVLLTWIITVGGAQIALIGYRSVTLAITGTLRLFGITQRGG